ncbi:MAG: TlpA family protein disulfide reductase [Elusimicrobiota bacterium]|jgi:glutathione peroxidase-family protein|nr:TlpA family protein disulfide reductase [Elusimicrobiota bacterium]
MKKMILLTLIIFVVCFVKYAEAKVSMAQAMQTDGMPFTLSMYKGKPIMIVYMSAKCGWCHKSVPLINSFYRRYSQDDIVIIGAFFNETKNDALDFQHKLRAEFPLLYNTERLRKIIPVSGGTPEFIILNKNHKVSKRIKGYPDDASVLDEALKKVVNKSSGWVLISNRLQI